MTPLDFTHLRSLMVREQLEARNITDSRVLAAMRDVPRHHFVPTELSHLAYRDSPLPIGQEQTISQPYIVAYMLEALQLNGYETILEVGTGSGYQTALLAQLAHQVISIERVGLLAEYAAQKINNLGIENIEIYEGDGSQGLPDMAPFDAIIVSAAAPSVPQMLMMQLNEGGRLVLPVGDRHHQYLEKIYRIGRTWQVEELIPVMFVPLLGRYGFGQRTADSTRR